MALFTRDNAKEMSAKANAIRWSKRVPESQDDSPESFNDKVSGNPDTEFKNEVLLRIRAQLRMLLDKADTILEKRDMDMKEMRDLAVSIKELENVEARLSNRPAPGNLRPVAQSKPKRQQSYAEPEPMPVQIAPEPLPASGDSSNWKELLF